MLGFSEWALKPKGGLRPRSPASDLALTAWPGPEPHPHLHLHAFTQPWKRPNLHPRSQATPGPSPTAGARALPHHHHAPASASQPDFPLWASLRLMHPPTSAQPARVPSGPGRLPSSPHLFPAPPLALGASRFGQPEAARPDSPSGAGGRGPWRARERCPGAGAAAAKAAVTTNGGSHPAGSSGRISVPRQPPRRHRPALACPMPSGNYSFSTSSRPRPPDASWDW